MRPLDFAGQILRFLSSKMLAGSASSVALLVLCLVAFLTAVSGNENLNKTDWCASFVISDYEECSDEQWQGVLKDMFSPDDTCPDSTRYIDVTRPTNAFYRSLEVSASGTDDNCNSTWGRRFNSTTSVNPTISRGGGYEGPCVRTTSFVSKVTPDNPLYADAQAGALNFTLKLGTVNGSKVNMWNGVYDGQGGDMNGAYGPFDEALIHVRADSKRELEEALKKEPSASLPLDSLLLCHCDGGLYAASTRAAFENVGYTNAKNTGGYGTVKKLLQNLNPGEELMLGKKP